MASRRLDISSLLCDDPPPAFSPLEALVHAASEERKRLDASVDRPQELDPYELERRRRIQQDELLESQKYAHELELRRQKEIIELRAKQEHELELRRREEDERRRFEYERERQREYEQQIRHREEQERLHRLAFERQRELELADERHRQHRSVPVVTPAISHLVLPRKADPMPIINNSPLPLSVQDEQRPIKKRRYSESPTRLITDDKERIAREREKMHAGELGYGRTDSPLPGPSYPPRRPGSGHGHTRKPVAVADLLADKEPARSPDAHRVVSPLGGRRSPPGSQIGRAKAARKSDDHLLREPPPPPQEAKKIKEEPKPFRPHTTPSQPPPPRVPILEDIRLKKAHITTHPPPPPPTQPPSQQFKTHTHIAKTQQEDAHEWFIQQYDEEPSPTTSARPEPPHTPSPSLSPITSTVVAAISILPKSPPSSQKPLTPKAAAVATLEQELEELVSEPITSSSLTIATTIGKKQQQEMDLVDLAVSELVETLENDNDGAKPESGPMEVDVEDELLSLVDDRPPPTSLSTLSVTTPAPSTPLQPPTTPLTSSGAARRLPGSVATSSHASASSSSAAQLATTKPAPPTHRVITVARPVSPTIMSAPPVSLPLSASMARQATSTKATSERDSMPPPASTSVGSSSKKPSSDRAGSVTPVAPPTKKKKEATAKARTFNIGEINFHTNYMI